MRIPSPVASFAVIASLGALVACSGSDDSSSTSASTDTTTSDTTPDTIVDTTTPDSAAPDTAPGETDPERTTPDDAAPNGSEPTAGSPTTAPTAPAPTTAAPSATTVADGSQVALDGEFPGGTAGIDVLEPRNWLANDGRLFFGETQPAPEVQAALCDYLVGAPAEVGEAAGLPGTVTLEDGSGYQIMGGGGTGFRCGYEVDGEFAFGMVIWTEDLREDVATQRNTVGVALPNGLFGATVYDPAYPGTMIDAAASERWLNEAGNRVD